MRILLAVDPSPDSKNVTQMITHFAEPPDLDVLNVVDLDALTHAHLSPTLLEGYLETYRKEVSEIAERVLHETRVTLTPHARQIQLIADTGDPSESIVATAEESGADLVTLGQRGMTATPAFLLGGVSQKVALHAPCSVLVVKGPNPTLERILLAVDGSDTSSKAAQFLASCPFKAPVRLKVVTVWPAQRLGLLASAPQAQDLQSQPEGIQAKGEAFLRGLADTFRQRPYEVETEWLQGDPAGSILDAIGRHGSQMVVVGARGLKAIKRFLLGSVSQKILVHAPCSVLIIR